jgi:ATP-dependent exoDNAse (exonuclease V) alpha subunit
MRRQFPFNPAFGITIHKSQSQTIQRLGMYVSSPIFAHGQLYVAFSRVGDPTKISIIMPNRDLHQLRNIVFPDIVNDDDESDFGDVEY